MKVEVACGEEGVTKDAFWVATVMAIGGKEDRRIHASPRISDGISIYQVPSK